MDDKSSEVVSKVLSAKAMIVEALIEMAGSGDFSHSLDALAGDTDIELAGRVIHPTMGVIANIQLRITLPDIVVN